jgi:hypothetical protein
MYKMPPLTIDGKRLILKKAVEARGEKAVLAWLSTKGIGSIREIFEHVRKYKAGFFRELYTFSCLEDE